ncbi:hypothetical protein EJB05_31687, partial [Eragrostis curvula]
MESLADSLPSNSTHANNSSSGNAWESHFQFMVQPNRPPMQQSIQKNMERLNNSGMKLTGLSYHILKEITNDFSQKVGHGGYGEVYKGVYNGKDVAVKKLYDMRGIDDNLFKNELNSLMRVRHQNIVQLLGYCYEISHEYVQENGELFFVRMNHRVLCFEYLHDGSLDKHLAYVPPEYIHSRHITDKYDIFSLGIIIIQIMTGSEGHSKYLEMTTPEQFIEHVYKNRRNRLEATSMHVEEYSQQVKSCIKIASNCLEFDRKKRPTIGHIINELIQTETVICEPFPEESSSASTVEEIGGGEEVELSTIGPWGGNAGKAHTIKGTPHRLESVTIWSADVIDALAFSYIEPNGKKHSVGPWGGPGGSVERIQFGPSEFLLEVSGTTGPYNGGVADVVKSVKLVTNAASYGPFGSGGGTSFKTSVQNNDNIVGFFGRAATFVHAIGIYTSHSPPDIAVSSRAQVEMGNDWMEANFDPETIEEGDRDDDENAPSKIGPWGGNGGMPHDMKVVPHRMESMTVCSDAVVNSLAFSYNDRNGKQQMLGPWGTPGGSSYTIRLGAFEHLKGIIGTFGPFDAAGNIITSLTITTNLRRYGPFGRGGGTEFTVPVEVHGSVVGFFGRAGTYLDALGVYIRTY